MFNVVDHSLVHLGDNGEKTGDYINANYIKVK